MKKIVLSVIFVLLTATILASCSTENQSNSSTNPLETATVQPTATATEKPTETAQPQKADVNIAALKGATAITMVSLMNESEQGIAANNYKFEIFGTADEVVAKLTAKELDIAAIPCNLASVLHNKLGVKVIAINTLGVLYIADTTGTINSIADLKGKTVYTVGKGTTPEFALNYVLTKNGLVPGTDVTIEFKAEAAELSALLAAGEVEIAMLPEPSITTALAKNQNAKIALNLTEEWAKVQPDFNLLTGAVVVRADYLDGNKSVVDSFLDEYKSSVEFANASVDETAALVEKYGIAPAAIAKQAIPRCSLVFITGDEMKNELSGYLQVLYDSEPKSVGGKLPDGEFYYKK